MILILNTRYSPLSKINWLVFVMEKLCAFCNVGNAFLNMVQIRGGQICHKAKKHHKILGTRKLILNKFHTGVPQTPYWRPTNTILASHKHHTGVPQVQYWRPTNTILASHKHHTGVLQTPYWRPTNTILAFHKHHTGVLQTPYWRPTNTILASHKYHTGVPQTPVAS